MARPVNGKPQWLLDRIKEEGEASKDGVPDFLDFYLRMKYDQEDIERIMDGYEHERDGAVWVNTSLCSVGDAQAAAAELGVETAAHKWCPNALACSKDGLEQIAQSELVQDGRARVLADPTALMAVEVAAQAIDKIYAQRDAEYSQQGQTCDCGQAVSADRACDKADDTCELAEEHEVAAQDAAAPKQVEDYRSFDDDADEPAAADSAAGDGDAGGADVTADFDADGSAAQGDESEAQLDPRVVRVAELCAGEGNMTVALSAAAGDKASILACEVAAKEHGKLEEALEVAAAHNVTARRYDSRRFRADQRFDVIVLDPPCTPTGTLYAHDPSLHTAFPDAQIPECMALEKSLFLLALSMLEVGGVLVYTTTSVLALENEELIRTCLARCGSLGSFEVEQVVPSLLDGLPQLPVDCSGAVLTCPSKECAGRFVAKVCRTA